jgi:hypothetical protein
MTVSVLSALVRPFRDPCFLDMNIANGFCETLRFKHYFPLPLRGIPRATK